MKITRLSLTSHRNRVLLHPVRILSCSRSYSCLRSWFCSNWGTGFFCANLLY
jgi:hypothetical protein